MNAAEQRIVHLEQLIAADEAAIANLQNQVAALNQAQRTTQASQPGGGSGGVCRGIVVTAIPTGTSSSPSTSGTVAIQRWNASTMTSSADPNQTAATCCNDHTFTTSIASGKCVKVAMIDGNYWLIATDC